VVATLACAGNRRAELLKVRPIPGKEPWTHGAIATAKWRGARLADVLEAAGVHDDAGLHVAPEADPDTAAPGEGISLSSLALNCDILVPTDDAVVPVGLLTVRGWAVAGDGHSVDRVHVSVDEGRSWHQADLAPASSRWAWRWWSLTVEATPGPLSLTARAWDDTGVTQPESPASLWNPRGYGNNAYAHIKLFAR
jgi:Mo-co oxidoreductase dimerisation domain/Oxidoreductase molybdopterin binding domain